MLILLPPLLARAAAAPSNMAVVGVSVATVHASPNLRSEVVTQALLGDRVQVLERFRGWARVLVSDQYRLAEGYPGWVPGDQLRDATPQRASYMVRVPRAQVHSGVTTTAYMGTQLVASGRQAGPEWVSVLLPGRPPGQVRLSQVTAAPLPLRAGTDIVETARQFLGTHYVWGGLTIDGIDCSGLVYVVFRLYGVTLPRDADQQSAMGTAVAAGDLQAGDLIFFGRDADHITHVGIYAGRGQMLEASGDGGGVCVSSWKHRRDFRWARRVIGVPLSMPPPSP